MVNIFGRNSAAQLAAPQSRQIWLRVGGPILALILAVMAGAFVVLGDFARSEDEDWRDESRSLMQGAVAGAQRASVTSIVDFAYWGQAYEAITRGWNKAWLRENLFSAAADGLVVYRPGDAVRYSWFKDVDPRSHLSFAALIAREVSDPKAIETVVKDMRKREAVIERFAVVNGQLAVISAAPVSFETAAQRRDPKLPPPRDFLAAIDFITPAELAQIGQSLRLQNLRFTPAAMGRATPSDFVSLEIRNPGGQIVGALEWKDERPGAARFAHRALGAAMLLLSIGAAAILAARYLVARHVEYLAKVEMNAEMTRMKAQFIATMGHALRTPLDAIVGYAELMSEFIEEDSTVAREIRADATRINESARQLMRVVNEILDHARLEAGHLSLRLEPLAASYVLGEVSDAMKDKAAARGNVFETFTDEPLLTTYADHARLAQCLVALADHAIRFTEDGRITITARASVLRGRPSVSFEVKDTGAGLSEDILARLFTPFAQWVDLAGYYYQADAGLGLSTARRLAVAMGGDVLAASAPGKGTTLTLVLPAALAAQQAA